MFSLPPFKPVYLVPILIGAALALAGFLLFPDLFRV